MINNTKPPRMVKSIWQIYVVFTFSSCFHRNVHLDHYDTNNKGSMFDLNYIAVQIDFLLE